MTKKKQISESLKKWHRSTKYLLKLKKKSHILLFILSGILFCLTPTSYAQTVELDHDGNRNIVTDSILTGTIDTSQVSATSPGTVWTGKYVLYEGTESRYKHSVKLPKFYEPFGTEYVTSLKLNIFYYFLNKYTN